MCGYRPSPRCGGHGSHGETGLEVCVHVRAELLPQTPRPRNEQGQGF